MMGWGSMYFTGYRKPEVWAKLGMMGDKLSFTNDDTVNKLGLGYIKAQGDECAMDTAVRYTLLNAGENGEINAKQMLNQHTRLAALVEEGIVADGWYKDDEDEKQRAWVYHEDGIRLHWNQVGSSYSYDNTHFSANVLGKGIVDKYDSGYSGRGWSLRAGREDYHNYRNDLQKHWEGDSFTLIPLMQNIRAMSHYLEDKVVLRAINKSLNRMVKSGKAVQVTAGRGRTFRWNAWSWLDEYRQKHLVTMAKQRKLGDKVNGWEYTKGQVTNMYGVEVCDHEWRPVEKVTTFFLYMQIPKWGRYWDFYGYDHTQTTEVQLPHLFFDEEEAQNVADEMNQHSYPRTGLSIRKDGKTLIPVVKVLSQDYKMTVDGTADIESYAEPLEMFKQMQLGSPSMYNQLHEMLREAPKKFAGSVKTEE